MKKTETLDKELAPQVRRLLRKPLTEILSEVDSRDRHTRGVALEALAFSLMRLVNLRYVGTRLRGDATGGAEVDLIFEGSRLVFPQWQIQCKKAAALTEDDAAKEVGLLPYFGSDVAVIVSTGTVEQKARQFAEIAHRSSRRPIVLIGGEILRSVAENPSLFVDAIRMQAPEALALSN